MHRDPHPRGRAAPTLAAALSAALLSLSATDAAAQAARTSADARWQPWLGCWSAVGDAAAASDVCVVPTSDAAAVEIVSLAGGKVVARERLAATGTREPRADDGCTGWKSAQWSADGRRLFLRAEAACGAGLPRVTHGVLAFVGGDEWVDVRGLTVGESATGRVVRYRETKPPAGLPAELATALPASGAATEDARLVANEAVDFHDVAEASRQLDPGTVEVWLAERRQGFRVDGRRLAQLADAGVPPRIIDVVVALSYPQRFQIAALGEGTTQAPDPLAEQAPAPRIPTNVAFIDPGWAFGWGAFSPFALSRFGVSPYSYSPYAYGSGYGWYAGSRPVIVTPRNPADAYPDARAVKGRGYSRGRDATDDGSGASTSRGSSGGSSGGGASRDGYSGGSRGSGGRTAKPRP